MIKDQLLNKNYRFENNYIDLSTEINTEPIRLSDQ